MQISQWARKNFCSYYPNVICLVDIFCYNQWKAEHKESNNFFSLLDKVKKYEINILPRR